MVNSENNQDLEILAQRVARRGSVLPGTRPYWSDASKKLKAQIRDPNCKSPHLFFTVSAADIQWPDLHQHMPNQPEVPPESEQEAYRLRMANLNDNPAIAAYYFQKRWQIFYEEVVKPQLKVIDYWWRFEWQNRGSSHIHGFLWLADAPSVEDLKLDDDQSVHQFVTFWDKLVSTWNPKPNHLPAPVHPASLPFTSLSDTQQELVELINRVQRHAKCSSYCLHRDKTTREEVCRFRFPQDLRELTQLVQKEGESLSEFLTKRNDPFLNSYNPTWILGWRANMDFRPVLSPHAAISYISKYVSKAETQSKAYQDILRTVVGQVDDNARAATVYQKMLSSLLGERDISGKYFTHITLLFLIDLQHRKFVTLYLGLRCGFLLGNIALSESQRVPLMKSHLFNVQTQSPFTCAMLDVLLNLNISLSMNSTNGLILERADMSGVVHMEQNHM